MLIDCHNHSNNSFDATGAVKDICARADELNMLAFAVTDHCEFYVETLSKCIERISASKKEVEAFRENYKGNCQFLTGFEIGQGVDFLEDTKKVIELFPCDVVLSSYHNNSFGDDFGHMNFDHYTDEEIKSFIDFYFDKTYESAKILDMDVLTHLTYPLRYVVGDYKRKVDINIFIKKIELIFKVIIENGISLEINTSGLRQKIGETLPNKDLLLLYKSLGGELVSLGSDSHHVEDVGKGIKEGIELLKETGFTHITYFKQRNPIKVEI